MRQCNNDIDRSKNDGSVGVWKFWKLAVNQITHLNCVISCLPMLVREDV